MCKRIKYFTNKHGRGYARNTAKEKLTEIEKLHKTKVMNSNIG